MSIQAKRLLFWGGLLGILLVGLAVALRPRAVIVDTVTVQEKALSVSVGDEGETRVHDVYVVSSPVRGRVRRIELHAGDAVVAYETVVAEIEPIDPAFLDPRSEAQAQSDLNAAESVAALARAEVEQAHAELQFARREYERSNKLLSDSMISDREFDNAERNFRTRRAAHTTALARLQVRTFEVERAQAALLSPKDTQASHGSCDCVAIRAPVNGRVLRVLQQSEGVVEAAAPLLEIGDPRDLEIKVDLLSADAVKVRPGQRARVTQWGGDRALEGRVRTVEPFGYTKTSALGIEEQRVNVIVDLTSPPEDWSRLAHGYQVDVDIVLWEEAAVLTVPLLALFRDAKRWAVFVAADGIAQLRHVEIGKRNHVDAQVLDGIRSGERVITHPSNRIAPGVRIRSR